MSYDNKDWIPEDGNYIELSEYKNDRIIEIANKYYKSALVSRNNFQNIMDLIHSASTIEELSLIKI
jgi:hypothetical protein